MNDELPTYEVEELSLEQAVVMLASDEEKYRTDYRQTSEWLLKLCPGESRWAPRGDTGYLPCLLGTAGLIPGRGQRAQRGADRASIIWSSQVMRSARTSPRPDRSLSRLEMSWLACSDS